MPGIVSRCNICSNFFNSKRELKEHKDKDHRITDSKMRIGAVVSHIRARHKLKVIIKTILLSLDDPQMGILRSCHNRGQNGKEPSQKRDTSHTDEIAEQDGKREELVLVCQRVCLCVCANYSLLF